MKIIKLYLTLVFSFTPHALFSYEYLFDQNKGFITCSDEGELGNALFRSAACINFAIEHNYSFFIYPRYKKKYPIIFSKLQPYEHKKTIDHVKGIRYLDSIGDSILPNTLITGYPHSYLYFEKNKDTILSLFSPSKEIKSHLSKKFNHILSNQKKHVGLHIRTFHRPSDRCILDRPIGTKTHLPCSFEYYEKAINYFGKDRTYVVFSDNTRVAKKLLERYSCSFIYMDNTKLYEDFYLMSLLENLIISNSTFAWWSAYLNINANKQIVTPWPWFRFQNYVWEYNGLHAICPPDWIEINQGKLSLEIINEIKAQD